MRSQQILILEPELFNSLPLSLTLKKLTSFLAERGNKILNLELLTKRSSSGQFEKILHLLKDTDLAIFLINEESFFCAFFLSTLLLKAKQTLLFSQNPSVLRKAKQVTLKPFHTYFYQEIDEILQTLKLFKV